MKSSKLLIFFSYAFFVTAELSMYPSIFLWMVGSVTDVNCPEMHHRICLPFVCTDLMFC
jgi:hypothetical protein